MKTNRFFRIFALSLSLFAANALAYDGDMDIYHEFKEELALIRDGYLACINMAMDEANEATPDGWFKARDEGRARTWNDLDYSAPEKESLPHVDLQEIPYGFHIKGADGAYKLDVKVRVVTRDTEVFYDVNFAKGSNGPGKEIFGEVFQNDRKVFYDNGSPCKKEAVTCINQYARGTLGK